MFTSTNDLTSYLREEISANYGAISFARFMELALYHPNWGYYCRDHFTIGKEGDFTTAPHISPLFAQCFAREALQIFPHLRQKNILELGAGSGQFAHDILTALDEQNALPDHYYIYEISEHLRHKQKAFLEAACPLLFPRCVWLEKLPDAFTGIVIANEVLDAMPVHTFRIENNQVYERSVSYQDNQFTWKLAKPSEELEKAVENVREQYHLYNGYESEINLGLAPFLKDLANCLQQGVILLIDYGYGAREYYHPERKQGTLTCFYQHQSHADPLIHVGEQDITAHVNFTEVAELATSYGLELTGYTTQAGFLLATGLPELIQKAESHLSTADEFTLHQAVKRLTMPTEMGELVKVIALSKDVDLPLTGFALQDRRWDL